MFSLLVYGAASPWILCFCVYPHDGFPHPVCNPDIPQAQTTCWSYTSFMFAIILHLRRLCYCVGGAQFYSILSSAIRLIFIFPAPSWSYRFYPRSVLLPAPQGPCLNKGLLNRIPHHAWCSPGVQGISYGPWYGLLASFKGSQVSAPVLYMRLTRVFPRGAVGRIHRASTSGRRRSHR